MSRDRTAHQAKARGGCMDEFSLYALSWVGLGLVLQIRALWKLSGMWRKAAWLSAAVMGLALVVAILGVLSGSISPPYGLYSPFRSASCGSACSGLRAALFGPPPPRHPSRLALVVSRPESLYMCLDA